ncbi:MAG: hypothetical protein N3E50_10415 [Candidatus Goldbacteria bacterium]|nr:hypothetical protein [Candidatus Goldiibacteriota bacterium]
MKPREIGILLKILFVVFLLIAIFATSFSTFITPDTWSHLANGKELVKKFGLPGYDRFSFTEKSEWNYTTWLFDIFLYSLIFNIGPFNIYIIKFILFVLLIFVLFLVIFRRQEGKYISIVLPAGLFALFILDPFLKYTPVFFALLFLSYFLYVLERRPRKRNKALYYSLPLITLLWSNMDTYALISIFVILIYWVYRFLETIEEPVKKEIYDFKLFVYIFLLTLVAVFLNPYLYKNSWLFIKQIVSNKWFNGYSFDLRGIKEMSLFYLYFLIIIVVLLYDIKGADVGRHGEFVKDVTLLTVFGILAAKSYEFIPFFMLISIPIFLYYIYLIFRWDIVWQRQWTEADLLKVKNPLYVLLILILITFSIVKLLKPQEQNYPVGAINYISSVSVPKNIFVPSQWAGFFEYFLYPEYKIMFDPFRNYKNITKNDYEDIYNWNMDNVGVVERYDINSFLLDYTSPSITFLKQQPKYNIAYFDDISVLFVNNEKTDRFFKYIKPLDQKFYDASNTVTAIAELENFTEEFPSEKAILLLTKLYADIDKNKAIDYLIYITEKYPSYYSLLNYKAKLYFEVGDYENAKETLKQSKKIGSEEAAILKEIKLKTRQTKL